MRRRGGQTCWAWRASERARREEVEKVTEYKRFSVRSLSVKDSANATHRDAKIRTKLGL